METRTAKIGNLIVTGYSTDYVFRTVERTGDFYESELLRNWTPLLDSPKYILDIGANLGNHTLFWGTQLDSAQIISVEPFEDNYKLLCENIEKNNLKNVFPLKAAFGEKDGVVTVKQFNPENYGGTTFVYADDVSTEEHAAQVKTADNVVSELQFPRIDFAKIDTEGFEFSVLKGMQRIIDRDHPVLWIEVGKETVIDVYTLLRGKGYNLVELSAANTLFIPAEKAHGRNISLEFLLSENLALLSKVNTYYSNYETSKKWLAAKDTKLQEREAKISHLQKEFVALQEKQKQQLQHLQEIKETEIRVLEQANDRAIQAAVQQVLQEAEEAARRLEQNCEIRIQQVEQASREKVRQAEQDRDEKLRQLEQICEIRIQQAEQNSGEKLGQAEQEKAQLAKKSALLEEEKTVLSSQLERAVRELEKDEKLLVSIRQQLLQMNGQLQQARQQVRAYREKLDKIYGTWYGRIALKCYKVLQKIKHKIFRK